MAKFRTHYDNLQVAKNASSEVIRGAYKYLSHKWHPDKNPDNLDEAARISRLINAAYHVLSDLERRREHDIWIAEQRNGSSASSAEKNTQNGNNEPPSDNSPPRNSETNDSSDGEIQPSPINHEWAWAASAVPLVAVLCEMWLPPVDSYLFYVYATIGAYVICCWLDERELKKAGYDAPNAFWVVLVPVYLWRRDTPFSKWRPRFIVWLIAFVLSVFLDSGQYVIGDELSGVWNNEGLGNVDLVLDKYPKIIVIENESMKVRFLNTVGDEATYEFVSGKWSGMTVVIRKIPSENGGFTLDILFFDDPELIFPLGWIRAN